jgi:hypothetical protein
LNTKYQSVDPNAVERPNLIPKTFTPKNIDIKIRRPFGANIVKQKPTKKESNLKVPTAIKDNKFIDKDRYKIMVGNQPNQRRNKINYR